MGAILERNEGQSLIRLEGAVEIGEAAELKQLLVEALGRGLEVRVSLESAKALDVTAVQLLWAAERQARGSGVGFVLAGEAPEAVLSALAQAGFEGLPVPAAAG